MNLLKIGVDGDVSNYIPNSEWTLVRMHVDRNVVFYSCCAEPYPDITYTLQVTLQVHVVYVVQTTGDTTGTHGLPGDITYTVQMRRKPLFYVFNMIMPCFLITLSVSILLVVNPLDPALLSYLPHHIVFTLLTLFVHPALFVFLITLVALLGFYVPSDSGEKVSMGITTLLSMTVFLMLVAENMPPTSDVLPLVGRHVTLITCDTVRHDTVQYNVT